MKDLLYLRDDQIKDCIQLLLYAYRETFSDPNEVLKIEDKIDVKILEVSSEDRKLAIGIKQLKEDPWANFKVGDKVKSEMIELMDDGILFNVSDSLKGAIFFKGLNDDKKNALKEKYELNQSYDLFVKELNPKIKSLILSDSIDVEKADKEDSSEEADLEDK